MNNRLFVRLLLFSALIFPGCIKDQPASSELTVTTQSNASGATQISGLGFFATQNECDIAGMGAAYAVRMTGDLEGCLFVYIDAFDCNQSGTYKEEGREYFVGTYNGQSGTFWTAYKFEAKYEGCAESGAPLGAEIFGRCQHPLVKGTGTGVFAGATGRVDMKDDIEAGNFPIRGHIKFD